MVWRGQSLVILQQPACQCRLKVDISGCDRMNGLHQVVCRSLLGDVTGCSGCQHLHQVLFVIMYGQGQDQTLRVKNS